MKNLNATITSAVLRSQPPNPEDVPAMVDYFQKYGGGTEQKFVKDVGRFIQVSNLSTSNRISGRIFAALAALSFGTVLPAYAVMAVLKRVAASQKIIDGICSSVTAADIARFGTKLKAEFLEIDGVIRKAEVTLENSDLDETTRILKAGWLQMTLIDHILGRPNRDGDEFKNIQEVVAKFVLDVFGQAPQASAAPGAPVATAASSIVQYDTAGSAIDVAKMILLSQGFQIGNVYCAKGHRASHPSEPMAWKLISIAGDGSTKLQAYSNVGVLLENSDATVTGAELADQFVLFDKKFLLHDNYPSHEAHHTGSSKTDLIPDRVRECMQVLAKTMIDHRLDIRTSPSKAVFAKADLESDIAVGKLRLTPVSRSYTLFDGSKKGAVDHPRSQCTTVCPDGAKVITAICQPGIDNVCNAYWFIGVTDEEG